MRTVQHSFLAGAVMIVFAGFSQAQAQSLRTHVLAIHLPGGGVEGIQYSGDAPPEIFLGQASALAESPMIFSPFGPGSAFAALDRMSEEMDRRTALLLREATAMADRIPAELIQDRSGSLPYSGQSYRFVSAISANGVCGHSVEITSLGEGKEPRVVSRSFGHCGMVRPTTARGSLTKPAKPQDISLTRLWPIRKAARRRVPATRDWCRKPLGSPDGHRAKARCLAGAPAFGTSIVATLL